MYIWNKALPVWLTGKEKEEGRFAAFYSKICYTGTVSLAISARSVYRLYVNGKMVVHGPARCTHGYARIDTLRMDVAGETHIAIEVAAYTNPLMYSNDSTLEPGMLICEIQDAEGNILACTGSDFWVTTQTGRRANVEYMSHSRGVMEVYDLTPGTLAWRQGISDAWAEPEVVPEIIRWLPRRSPYATYRPISFDTVQSVGDVCALQGAKGTNTQQLAELLFREYYASLPKENRIQQLLLQEGDAPFTGSFSLFSKNGKPLSITPGEKPAFLMFGMEHSEVGFIHIEISIEEQCILDVISSDHLEPNGALAGNTYAVRYCLAPGQYDLTTFEPKLVRYMKCIFRTKGEVRVSYPELYDYTYPDARNTFFSCSDGDLNAIYAGARRTLRLNTMDIFMDCPERERGGWLCDSYFTAKAAWQMFGDASVEKDFLENFLLTDGRLKWNGFFPEVYPANKRNPSEVGITDWSFFLAAQLCDYVCRTGDRDFALEHKDRITLFVDGLLSLRGESGLLENLTASFVDWSISNTSACLSPISVPVNAVAIRALKELADLYEQPQWAKAAEEMQGVIDNMDANNSLFAGERGDRAEVKNGVLQRGEIVTESGIAFELWGGLHSGDQAYISRFVNSMGCAPKNRPDPNVGKANNFIGLIIRQEILAGLDRTEELVNELKALYLPELRDGSGTFFEGYSDTSGCHGANAIAGALLTQKVLGLGCPCASCKTVLVSPNPCGLKWAQGSADTSDGPIFLRWSADEDTHTMHILLTLPEGWSADVHLPFALTGWTVTLNGKSLTDDIRGWRTQ